MLRFAHSGCAHAKACGVWLIGWNTGEITKQVMTVETTEQTGQRSKVSGVGEIRTILASIPEGPVFALVVIAWLCLFHFLGNSNFGNEKTPSLFHWMEWVYGVN